MAAQPQDRWTPDELEHQALDVLDSVPFSGDAAVEQADLAGAIAAARPLFIRLVALAVEDLLVAAEALAVGEDRGSLELEAIDRARRALNEHPEFAPAFARAVEMVGVTLGLDRESIAWGILVELGERASAEAPEPIQLCARAVGERLDAAQGTDGEPSRALRVFRSAAGISAGPELRARLLAADHPQHLTLARALIEASEPSGSRPVDAATLVDRFDAARATLAAAEPRAPEGPEARTDGPKRKFTIVHVILALIVLGLTVWHYVFR